MRIWSTFQVAVFAAIAAGTSNIAVNAVAGSGKTTTIVEGLKHVPAGCSTTFMAFNKKIADGTDGDGGQREDAAVVECLRTIVDMVNR